MAHRPTQRRNSAPSTAAPLRRPDPTSQPSKPSFTLKQLSKSLNLGHKSMAASAVNDSSSSTTKRSSKEEKACRKKKSNLFEDAKSRNRDVVEDDGGAKRRSSSSSSVSMVGQSMGRRRSMCGSEVELGDVFAINGVKMVSADMPPFMQIHAVDCARKALDSMEKFTSKTLALSLKKEFDGVYGPAWHCIVGTGFGSYVTHSVGGFLYFSMDHKLYILLFKTAVQKVN